MYDDRRRCASRTTHTVDQNARLAPRATADAGLALEVGEAGYAHRVGEAEQAATQRGTQLDLVTITGAVAGVGTVLRVARNFFNTLMTSDGRAAMLELGCYPDTQLVLAGCDASAAIGVIITCSATAQVLSLRQVERILEKNDASKGSALAMVRRGYDFVAVPGTAKMVLSAAQTCACA